MKKLRTDIEKLFNDHFRSATLYAESIIHSKEAAEDVVQDVFIKLLNTDLTKIESLQKYLYRSIKNTAINYTKELQTVGIDEKYTIYDVSDDELNNIEEYNKLYKAIEKLPEKARVIVKLVYLEKYSYAEVASELGVSMNTIKTHLFRSMRTLRNTISSFLLFS